MSDEVNGVPLEKMFGAIAKVKESSELAQFEFVAESEWITAVSYTHLTLPTKRSV